MKPKTPEQEWWREEADRILLRKSPDGVDDLCAIARLIAEAERRGREASLAEVEEMVKSMRPSSAEWIRNVLRER